MRFGHDMRAAWPLDPSVTYLNHGTVGVVPRKVLAAAQAIREEIERQPAKFMLRDVSGLAGVPKTEPTRLRRAAHAVASFIGARGDDVVFVDNATTGANAVLRSLALEPGDEILVTDHGYGAVTNIATYVARMRGAVVRSVPVPFPRFDPAALVDAIGRALTSRTRILLVDHITSETALIMPVAEIAAVCRARGVPVLVDGAHVPGVLRLDVPALGVDWYTANLHKWAHAPRSSGFLWTREDRQADLHPAVISWGLDKGYTVEFDWVGTRDPSPWLATPAGLAFLDELGRDAIWSYNHSLAWRAAEMLTSRWGVELATEQSQIGFMVTVALPERLGSRPEEAARLRDALLDNDRIEIQVHAGYGRLWARISAQVYNELSDYERLGDAIARRS